VRANTSRGECARLRDNRSYSQGFAADRLCCTNPARDSCCESSVIAVWLSRPNTPTYRTLNWPAYNKALKRRGSLTVWFDPDMVLAAQPTGKRGRQPVYSDAAVQTCLTMKVLFGMALRQIEPWKRHWSE
jgi:hypothetical protein